LTIVTELAAISGMEREIISGAERKRGNIFVPYDLRNIYVYIYIFNVFHPKVLQHTNINVSVNNTTICLI